MEKMTARFDGKHASNAVNLGAKKELIQAYSLVSDNLDESIIVRWYAGRSKYASTIT